MNGWLLFRFLPYLFASIAKFWPKPYPKIIFLYPKADQEFISHHLAAALANPKIPDDLKRKIRLYPAIDILMDVQHQMLNGNTLLQDSRSGYWDQQLWKLHADEVMPSSAFIMHVDCDCIFIRQQFPSTDFTVNGPSRLDSLTEEQDRQLCEYIGEQPGCTRGW